MNNEEIHLGFVMHDSSMGVVEINRQTPPKDPEQASRLIMDDMVDFLKGPTKEV